MSAVVRLKLLRVLVAALGAAGIVLGLLWVGPAGVDDGRPLYIRALLSSSWNIGFGAVAIAVAWKAQAERSILFAGLYLAVSATNSGLGQIIDPRSHPALAPLFIASGGFAYGVGIRFTQAFPVTLDRARLLGLARGPLGRAALWLPATLLRGRVFWPFMGLVEVVQHGLLTRQPAVWHVLVYASLAALYLWAGYRLGSPEERRRSFWIMEGVLVFLAMEGLWAAIAVTARVVALPFRMDPFTSWLTIFEGWAALTCFAIAIFFYGAFDSALVLRRTAILSVTSGLGLLLFIGVEETLGQGLATLLGLNSGAGAIVAGVVAAVAFRPVSERLDRVLTRRSVERLASTSDAPAEP